MHPLEITKNSSESVNIASSTPHHGRFTCQSATTEDLLSKQTEGLVALSEFRKRRAEVVEAKELDAQSALRLTLNGISSGNRLIIENGLIEKGSEDSEKNKKKFKKKRKLGHAKLSFPVDEEEPGLEDVPAGKTNHHQEDMQDHEADPTSHIHDESDHKKNSSPSKTHLPFISQSKLTANTNLPYAPKALTKAALFREAQARESLRKEFLLMQEAIKSTEIEIHFVFYDGTNIPGGSCRVRKGDNIWIFLDRCRKAGAELKIGVKPNSRRQWARVGVDDLMLVRGDLIIPHHFDFYYFIINRIHGPNNRILFDYSSEAPHNRHIMKDSIESEVSQYLLQTSETNKSKSELERATHVEGCNEDPTFTKVVDRRWYERNKHIYPASVWQEFDLEKDYQKEVKRDLGGNTFFYS